MVAILQADEALSNLEEVAVRLVWGKVDIENEARVGRDLLLSWQNFEWVLHHLASRVIEDRKQGPVDVDREAKLILESQLLGLADASILSEVEIDRIFGDSEITCLGRRAKKHLFVNDDLVRIIDRDLKVEVHVEATVHEGVLSSINVLGHDLDLSVSTHNHLVAVSVNVPLAERHRLRQHIVACTKEINVKNFVVLDEAEDALIVVASALGAESDDNTLRGVGLHNTLCH